MPAGIHAGGLRYHGMAPLVSHALREGLIEAVLQDKSKLDALSADLGITKQEG